jgi:hypothetical protein
VCDADLGKASSDCAHNLAAGVFLQLDVDQGMLCQERGQGRGKKLGGRRGIGEQAHARPKAVRELRQLPLYPLQLLHDSSARGRGADAAAMPVRGAERRGSLPSAGLVRWPRRALCPPARRQAKGRPDAGYAASVAAIRPLALSRNALSALEAKPSQR